MPDPAPAPLVSVVIPAFNVQTYVAEAIDSVLAQTFTNYEVIVVDDGSTDDTGRVVAAYGDRVRYVRQERAGPGRARNRGIELARGELIAFLDADDVWYPRKLEKQVALFRADPSLGLATTGEEYFDDRGATILYPGKRERLFGGGNVPGAIVLNSRVATPTVMAPRRVIQDLGGFVEDLRVGEDENLWVRITARYPADMVDEILVRCRLRPGSVTHDPEALLEGILVHLARLGSAYPEIRPLIQEALPRRRSRVNCDLGYWYFTQGRFPEARRAFRSSLRERWTNTRAWRYLLYSLAPAPIVRRIKELRGRVTAKVGPAATHSAVREGGVVGRHGGLRVLVVDNTFTFGGAITSLAHMVRGLQAWGVECVVVSGQPAETLAALFPGSVTHSIPLRLPWVHGDPFVDAPTREALQALPRWQRLARSVWWRVMGDGRSAVRLARIGRRHGVALVHANNTAASQRDAALAARLLRVPAVAHHRALADARYSMRKSGFRMHLAVSDAVRRSLLQVGASPEDVVVVHDAVDLEEFRPGAPPPSLRTELGIAEDAVLVGHFGRIVPWKGTREFVDAFAVVARADRSVHALIVGDRSDGPEDYEEDVHRAVREAGLGERLTFAGFRPDVPALMRACDIVVHTSTEPEPFGMVIVEAMATGKPVIAAPAGGPLEIVRPGVDGLLADPTDAAALASAIQRLAADPAARAAMGRAAVERVAEAFSKERYARDVAGVYESVTGVALRAKA